MREAMELTGHGDTVAQRGPDGKPERLADWVGPRAIVLRRAWQWRRKASPGPRESGLLAEGPAVMQLVEGT